MNWLVKTKMNGTQFPGRATGRDGPSATTIRPMQPNLRRPHRQSLPGLTGVRGVAALAVFLCHFEPIALSFLGFDARNGLRIVGNGFRGVDLFFILSGFILFHVHSQDFRNLTISQTKRFYLLRFFRVYPLNTVVLLFMLPIPFFLPTFVEWHRNAYLSQGAYHLRDFSLGAFVQSLLLAQTWTGLKIGTWNEPAWTLSAEVLGYSFFPFLAAFVCRQVSALRATLWAIVCLTIFVVLMVIGGHATNNPSGTFGAIRMVFCFVAGAYLCRSFQLGAVRERAAIVTVASVILIGVLFSVDRFAILSVFGFAGLILGLSYQAGPVHYFVTTKPIMYLGQISFSFYLVHLIPLDLFRWRFGNALRGSGIEIRIAVLCLLVALTVSLAALTYRLIEVPFQQLGRRLANGQSLFGERVRPAAVPSL